VPDGLGRVDQPELGLHGQWFSYGDNDDWPQSCTQIGMHPAAMCSEIFQPKPLPSLNFSNLDGAMCTGGTIGEQMPCEANVVNCKDRADFSNMWGAGIGLDFDLDVSSGKRDPLARSIWNAHAHHVVGIAFDFRLLDDGGLGGPHVRVEFPMLLPSGLQVQPGKVSFGLKPSDKPVAPAATDPPQDYPDAPDVPSEEHPEGSPYWGAGKSFGDGKVDVSPVHGGYNEIRFTDTIQTPESDYTFEPARLLGIQFHVSSFEASHPDSDSDVGEHFTYGFCISNLTFLRE
jgi:hypothetical protein